MSPTTITTVDPSTGAWLAEHPCHDERETDAILDSVVSAQRKWRTTALPGRAAALRRLGALLRDEVETHARLITTEMGKPIVEARGEVLKCAVTCDYYANHLEKFLAPKPVTTEARDSFVSYEPIGVVLAIMPWNFPYWQVVRFAAPTLSGGNGGLLKHAVNVTGCALALEDLFARAGFEPDLFRAVVVDDHDRVGAMIDDPRITAVTLTGSERAGRAVAGAAGQALKKTVLELGGSDPFVILDDADVETVAPSAVSARFVNTGQSCLCAKRFVVHAGLLEAFEQSVTQLVESLVVGPPLDEATQLGPLARKVFVDDVDRQVIESIDLGARLLTGGHRLDRKGFFYAPTVLSNVRPGMPVFDEETFGPVMAIAASTDDDEAATLADASVYGLAASVWTDDPGRGLELGGRITSGALFVNAVVASDPRLPFGGVKLSGYGRELSEEGMREFLNARTNWVADPAR